MSMSIDDHLRDEARLQRSFLGTLEPVPQDSELVRVTPYLGARCACHASLVLRKDDLEVEKTPTTTLCCGMPRSVFRIFLRPTAQVAATAALDALVRSASTAAVAELDDGAPSGGGAGERAMCNCEALYDWLFMLQDELRHATPGQKPALIKRIRAVLAQIHACGC